MYSAKTCMKLIEESEDKFRKIAENSHVGMFLYKDTFMYVNDAFARMTGYSVDELLSMEPWRLVNEGHRESLKELAQKRLNGEIFASIHNDAMLVKKNKEQLPVKISVETIHYRGSYAGIGTVIDISDLVKKNKVIHTLTQALAKSDDIVFITDVNGIIYYVNDALLRTYGHKEEEVLGKTPKIFASGKTKESVFKRLWETILCGENFHGVLINKSYNNQELYMDTKIIPVVDEASGKIDSFVVTARDISQRIICEEELKILATIDPLTQIPNRYQLHQYLDEFIIRSETIESRFAVLMFDIDHFKKINDTYGHQVGDTILKSFSRLIMQNIRKIDRFGRWGGEEFLLLLDGVDKEHALKIAEKLRFLVAKTKFDDKYHISVSIGVTEYDHQSSLEETVHRADLALYAAKNLGRNRVVYS